MLRYIDLHADTVTKLAYPRHDLGDDKYMVSVDSMLHGGALVQCFSAFVPTGLFPKLFHDTLVWNTFNSIADKKDGVLEKHADVLKPILSPGDVDESKIGVLFTIEDAGVIGSDLDKLRKAHERGVMIASLTWNHENSLAYPNSKNSDMMNRGLKPFGVEAVEEMQRLGIIVDVSHLNDGGFRELTKISRKPFIATHSNARAVTNHQRNLTDDMLKALADQGGVTGLNFCPQFLRENSKESRIEDMVRHVLHIRNVAGADVLAVGTDFDGIDGELEVGTPAKMPQLFDALSLAGLTDDELEKMAYSNFMRVFRETR